MFDRTKGKRNFSTPHLNYAVLRCLWYQLPYRVSGSVVRGLRSEFKEQRVTGIEHEYLYVCECPCHRVPNTSDVPFLLFIFIFEVWGRNGRTDCINKV
jgi:hypothetical protein